MTMKNIRLTERVNFALKTLPVLHQPLKQFVVVPHRKHITILLLNLTFAVGKNLSF